MAALARDEDSEGELVIPDEYGSDGKTNPKTLVEEKMCEMSYKNYSPNTIDDFEKSQKDLDYYKGIFKLLP